MHLMKAGSHRDNVDVGAICLRIALPLVVASCTKNEIDLSQPGVQPIQRGSSGTPHVATRYLAHRPDTDFPASRNRGVLVQRDGCIRIEPTHGKLSYTLLWPRGTRFLRDSQSVSVPEQVGWGVFRLGDLIVVDGGYIPENHAKNLGDLGQCEGDVWLVGNARVASR